MNQNHRLFDWYGWEATKYAAWFGWGAGTIFSYMGVVAVSNLAWWMKVIAFLFSIVVNIVEYMFNRMTIDEMTHPEEIGDVILTLFGVFVYAYDIWTNVLGFCVMFAGSANVILIAKTDWTLLIWPALFGFIFAVGPEPLYIRYLKNAFPKPKPVTPYQAKPQYQPKPQQQVYQQPVQPQINPELLARLRQQYPDKFPQNKQ